MVQANNNISIAGLQQNRYPGVVPSDMVAIREIADMLGVSTQRVSRIIQTHEDFPDPEAELSIGKVWLRGAVEEWAHRWNRAPGRRQSRD